MNIQDCPRCGGPLYPPKNTIYTTYELKCFSCGRLFYLSTNNSKPHWVQWPHRDEGYKVVYEDAKEIKALLLLANKNKLIPPEKKHK